MEYSQLATHEVIGNLGLDLIDYIIDGCGVVTESKDRLVIGSLLLPCRITCKSSIECLQRVCIGTHKSATVGFAAHRSHASLNGLLQLLVLGRLYGNDTIAVEACLGEYSYAVISIGNRNAVLLESQILKYLFGRCQQPCTIGIIGIES